MEQDNNPQTKHFQMNCPLPGEPRNEEIELKMDVNDNGDVATREELCWKDVMKKTHFQSVIDNVPKGIGTKGS
jgi:hypothetical protein